MREDEGDIGEHTRNLSKRGFIFISTFSGLLRRKPDLVVRYEACGFSLETMRSLTDDILRVPRTAWTGRCHL